MVTGSLFVIAAPSGAGKTSLVKALTETIPEVIVSISHTTRLQRPGEKNSVNYYFIDAAEFTTMINNNAFLEYAQVFGNYYGTSKAWVTEQLAKGIDVVLEIDWQGAQQVRKLMPECVSIFILPPSPAALSQRLSARKQDHPEIIAERLAAATDEISHYREFDYLIVNDVFDQALQDLQAIVQTRRLRRNLQEVKQQKLLQALLY